MTIDDEMKTLAANAVSMAEKHFGLALDFTEESIAPLESALGVMHADVAKTDPEASKTAVNVLVNVYGAYLGETIRKRVGGRWLENGKLGPVPALELPNGTQISPQIRILKRLREGMGGDVTVYFRAAVNDVERAPEPALDKKSALARVLPVVIRQEYTYGPGRQVRTPLRAKGLAMGFVIDRQDAVIWIDGPFLEKYGLDEVEVRESARRNMAALPLEDDSFQVIGPPGGPAAIVALVTEDQLAAGRLFHPGLKAKLREHLPQGYKLAVTSREAVIAVSVSMNLQAYEAEAVKGDFEKAPNPISDLLHTHDDFLIA